MTIFKNISVPVPEGAHVRKAKGIVYVVRESKYDSDKKYTLNKTVEIGRINSSDLSTMNPNNNYAMLFPKLFSECAQNKVAPAIRRIGMLACTAAISTEIGLYQALINSCGPEFANFILDFAMYSIQTRTNVARDFAAVMSDQTLFSERNYEDSWISDFFSHRLTLSDIENFKEEWIRHFMEYGSRKVWLCIDGSNNDCTCRECDFAEKGKAKSGKNVNIYSFMYAVDAQRGMPVYYQLDRGGKMDSKAFNQMISIMAFYGAEIEGVILDRGFCDQNVINLIMESGYKYVIMLKENLFGYKEAMDTYGEKLRNNFEYLVEEGIFACTYPGKVFRDSVQTSYITLSFDTVNASERIASYSRKVLKEMEYCQSLMRNEGSLNKAEDLEYFVACDNEKGFRLNENVQKAADRKGYCALACSENWSARQVLDTYDLRDASEKQFMILKTQLGYHTGRAHCTEGIESRHFVAFIAGIIRNEIRIRCKECGYDLNKALRELNFLVLHRGPNNRYLYVHNEMRRQKELLSRCHITEECLEYIGQQESRHMNGEICDQIIKLPLGPGSLPKRKVGRPKGSRNVNKTDSDSAEEKRGPGRPKGSKNKKTLEREMNLVIKTEIIKKGRGRPKGAKDKKPRIRRTKKEMEQARLSH